MYEYLLNIVPAFLTQHPCGSSLDHSSSAVMLSRRELQLLNNNIMIHCIICIENNSYK